MMDMSNSNTLSGRRKKRRLPSSKSIAVLRVYLRDFVSRYSFKGACLNREILDGLLFWICVEKGMFFVDPPPHDSLDTCRGNTNTSNGLFSSFASYSLFLSTYIREGCFFDTDLHPQWVDSIAMRLPWPQTHLHWDNRLRCISYYQDNGMIKGYKRKESICVPQGSSIWPMIKHFFRGHLIIGVRDLMVSPSSVFPSLCDVTSMTLVDDPSLTLTVSPKSFQWLSQLSALRIVTDTVDQDQVNSVSDAFKIAYEDRQRRREWWVESFRSMSQLTFLDCSELYDTTMADALRYLTNLRHLELWNKINSVVLETITMQEEEDAEEWKVDQFSWLSNLTRLKVLSCPYMARAIEQLPRVNSPLVHFASSGRACRLFRNAMIFKKSDMFDSLFRNLHSLCVPQQIEINDDMFTHLSGLTSLCIDGCSQTSITNDVFQHLPNLKRLSMSYCNQSTLSADGFRWLSQLTYLCMSMPPSRRFPPPAYELDKLLSYLPRLRHWTVPFFHHYGCKENPFLECPQLESLDIQTDELSVLTDESFSPLKNLKRFSIHHNERISPRAMDHLSSLTSLMPMDIRKGAVQCVDDTALSHLQNLRELCVGTSSLNIISDRGLRQMSYLTFLDICDCGCRGGITDHAFQHMKHLKELNMCDCKQTGLSNHMFSHLSNLSKLKMDGCTQSTITDHAFAHLSNLKRLSLVQCTQITSDALRHVPHLEVLACEIGEDTKAWNTPKLQLTTDEICCREEDDEQVKNC